MINRIVGLHFSPRGGTAIITDQIINELADRIAAECGTEISCETYDIFRRPLEIPSFDQDTIAVVAVPVRVGKMPVPALKVLENVEGSGAMTIAVVSYATRSYGNALYELYRRAEDRGFKVIGAGAFVTEHSGVSEVTLKRPDLKDMQEIVDFANIAAMKIKRLAGCEIEGMRVKPAPIDVAGRMPVHRISRLSPKAAAVAERTMEKLFRHQNESEWYV
ncbi:MAG: hypothetical protein KBS63_04665 [Clostridiales bacterium]|nr:hypothetical protein [Candidatus Crickella caballi]